MKLGRLEKVDLREVWKHEALDFSSWLAEEENLSLLSDEIGIELSLDRTEASVGNFSVDILAEEENTGRKVVIENQLESTNHDHLGKIITYASGYDAEIIIWIVKSIRDEHKQAIDWLNDHTDEKINFFAIRMEAWKIGDSSVAPKFQIVSKPNDWAKTIKGSGATTKLTETKLLQLNFWTDFNDFAKDKGTKLHLRNPKPEPWNIISIGDSRAYLALVVNTKDNNIRCEIVISEQQNVFEAFQLNKEIIHNKLGYELEWLPLEGKKRSLIRTIREADIRTKDEWQEYFNWFYEKAEAFYKVFIKELKSIKS